MKTDHKKDDAFSYDVYGNPSSAAEMKEKFDKAVKEAKSGDYIILEDLKKESKEWTKHTK